MKTINSFRSKLLALVLALVASVSSFAKDGYPDFQVDGLYYNFLEGDSVQVTFLMPPAIPTEVAADTSNKKNVSGAGYGHLTEIVIPSTVIYEDKTYHVNRIGHGAFMYCPNLMHIDLPTSIKSIGEAAFHSCRYLSSITLNEGLESIEQQAFWDCPTLKEVSLPSTLKSLKQKVFYDSKALSKVICKALVPPSVEKDLLTGTDNYNAAIIANATLYVPAQSLRTYQNTYPWNTFGQILPIEDSFQDLFPTLWGLERTDVEGTTMGYDDPYHMSFSKYTPTLVDGIWYLFDGRNYFREANNQILWYAPYLNIVDAVLYDWTLQVGDTLPIYSNPFHKDNNRGSLFRVTDVSTITLLDGKEYKKWTFSGGFEVVEGIGAINKGFGHYYCLLHTTHPAVYTGWKPICISKNGQLLYQMDEIKMISNELKCMCELTPSYKDQWCNTWNTIDFDGMRFEETAETWQYKLANDTIINNQKYTIVNRYWTADRNNTKQYVAAVRFTDDRKVYIYYDNAEYLLYDFNVQEGDELEVFAGINNYTSEIKTYKCTVTGVEQYACVGCPAAITLEVHNHPNDFREFYRQTQWIEGVGDINGFLNGINHYVEMDGGGSEYLLCAHKGDELKYTGPLYEEYGCEYNAGPFNEKLLGTWRVVGGNEIISISDSIIVFIGLTQKYTASATQLTVERLWIPEEESYRWANCNYTLSNDTLWIDNFMPLLVATYPPTFGPITLVKVKHEDLFPTLWGLQRTSFTEYLECSDSYASLFQSKGETITINDNQYLKFGGHYLREENKQVLLYSRLQDKDLVLYDYSLEVGDTLTTLNIDYRIEGIPFDLCYVDYAYEDVGMSHSIDTLIVTDVSYVTLLDGKEHKQWTFDNGMQYVEGIGNFGQSRWSGNFFGLVKEPAIPTCLMGEHLVCVSRNGKLLYQMDDAEMERLGAECLCDYNSGPKKDNAKNGKIGGRPTPTQWNQLEVETKEMDGTPTIVRAETFSYTLENDSIVAKGKTFYQLARQSTKDTAITKSFVGALHFGEDEDNRVYFLRDGVEYVLYDFTAEPGDTVEIFAGINNYPQETTYTHVVVDKDTTEDGACRMFLEVVFPDETTTATNAEKVWLAGLGSIDGIVHNAAQRTSDAHAAPARSAHSSDTQTSVMLCAWREDSCLYTTNHPEYDTFGCVYNQDPTGVEDVETLGTQYQKILRDGHLYILRDNRLYDVLGTPLN